MSINKKIQIKKGLSKYERPFNKLAKLIRLKVYKKLS